MFNQKFKKIEFEIVSESIYAKFATINSLINRISSEYFL